jgi:hypothetical protein
VDLDTGKTVKEAWAYCSPRDNPSRCLGRSIAKARLEKALQEHKESSVYDLKGKIKGRVINESFRTCPASALAELGV